MQRPFGGKMVHIMGPSLLFIHGAACNASVWEAQADYFAGKHPAYRLELPGHGGSGTEGEEGKERIAKASLRIVAEPLRC